MPGCQCIPQRRHVELVANSETGNMGLKKDPGLHALSRSLCHELCAVRDSTAPVVPQQEEISGAATEWPKSEKSVKHACDSHGKRTSDRCVDDEMTYLPTSALAPVGRHVYTHIQSPRHQHTCHYHEKQKQKRRSCIGATLKVGVGGRSRLLRIAPIDRSYTTLHWSCNYGFILYHPFSSCLTFKISWPWNLGLGHSRSLKLFHSKRGYGYLFAFYSNYGGIFWPFLRYLASYNGMILKPGLGSTQGHWKWHHSFVYAL